MSGTVDLTVTGTGEDWKREIQWNPNGKAPAANDYNTTLLIKWSPSWHGQIRFNEFSNRPEMNGKAITEDSVAQITVGLQCFYNLQVRKHMVLDAMTFVARRNSYHPVRDMLRGLQWDGVKRLDTWLHVCVGAEDNALHSAYGRKWLMAAVARVMQPGCKVDTMLILEGAQGIGKSQIYAILCGEPEWFLDQPGDPGSKEAKELQQGKWIIEYAELDKMRGADVSRIKGFVTSQKDSYRKAYGFVSEDFPRQCVFGGSVNPGATGYMHDETGARRSWPVTCDDKPINQDWLRANRDQLLAEAVAAYDDGETWHLEGVDLIAAQRESTAERYETDAWQEPIAAFIEGKHLTTSGAIAKSALLLEIKDENHTHTRRIGKVMTVLGWMHKLVRRKDSAGEPGKPVKCYVSPTWLATGGACGETVLTEAEQREKDKQEAEATKRFLEAA